MGTTAERSSIPVPATTGGWVELGRTTLGSAGDTITVSSLADKRYYMILSSEIKSGTNSTPFIRFNNDSGSNYARRYHVLGGEYTNTSVDNIGMNISSSSGHQFQVGYWANYASKEKLGIIHAVSQQTAGATTAPDRNEIAPKWANTSNAINRVDVINADSGTGDFDTGSEVVVLGWDPADTHTNNFWTQVGESTWSSGSSLPTVDLGGDYKYLWLQFWTTSASVNRQSLRLGDGSIDTGTNYATRYSENGGADVTSTSADHWICHNGNKLEYCNMFIVNTTNEKLAIMHVANTASNGAGSAPVRFEGVGKYTGASVIDQIQVYDTTNNFTGGQIKVWGAN